MEARAAKHLLSWSQNWGPKFGASSVFRKERDLVLVTNIARIFGSQEHACESDIVVARHRHSDTAGGWYMLVPGQDIEARDAPMHTVTGVP